MDQNKADSAKAIFSGLLSLITGVLGYFAPQWADPALMTNILAGGSALISAYFVGKRIARNERAA